MIPEPLRRGLSILFVVLPRLSTALAVRLAFLLFTTPVGARRIALRGSRRTNAEATLDQAVREENNGVVTWIWEAGDEPATVVLVHGWTSRTLYMTGFVAPLRARGVRVVAFDFPGHGESAGGRLPFDRAGRIAADLADRFGNTVLLGHSFGASMAVLAAAGSPAVAPSPHVSGLILVAGANSLRGVTQRFADHVGIPPVVKNGLDARLEQLGGDDLDRLTALAGIEKAGVPTLIVHDTDDPIVPYNESVEMAEAPTAELVPTSRLGHNRILHSAAVHEQAANWIEHTLASRIAV